MPDAPPGITVGLRTRGTWELTVNRPGTPVIPVYAPIVDGGAVEVAAVVHGILTGERRDPLQGRRVRPTAGTGRRPRR
ncbi:hypothetical protein [Kitasatospora sp. NPDC088783]|uniref:hypothetical protein n=1 Tax=Kitasatospora sp. NPDC088783 TaxID=3364077 RepID=UPI00380B3798